MTDAMTLMNHKLPVQLAQYSPQRDLGMVGARLMAHAGHWLKPPYDAKDTEYMQANNVTAEHIQQVQTALGNALIRFREPDVTLAQLLQDAALNTIPYPAIALVFSKLGQVLLGAYFSAVRDVLNGANGDPTLAEREAFLKNVQTSTEAVQHAASS